jgi:hypothetical protein
VIALNRGGDEKNAWNDSVNHFSAGPYRVASYLALQRRLGILPEQWSRVDRFGAAGASADRPVVNQIGSCGSGAGFPYWYLRTGRTCWAEIERRITLEEALVDSVPPDREVLARAFLSGLSIDELLFLAEFLGSCLLVTPAIKMDTWDAVSHQAHAFRRSLEHGSAKQREDNDHKLILLSEFATVCGCLVRFR